MTAQNAKLIPHLWYDKEAREAAEFYVSAFLEASISNITKIQDTPSGDGEIVSFTLWGQPFQAISAGPLFKFNPSVSFMVNFDPSRMADARSKIDGLWDKLSTGGKVLMPMMEYPFSARYGWLEDKYGLNWQLILTDPTGDPRPPIIPSLMFAGNKAGLAEQASAFYRSIFNNTEQGIIARYPADMEPDVEGTIMFSDFKLEDQWFAAMDSKRAEPHKFNEAISFLIMCDNQQEMDAFYPKLSAVPEAEQCGWIKDKYGLSWQIIPVAMDEMLTNAPQEAINRVVAALMPMKRINLAELERAYNKK